MDRVAATGSRRRQSPAPLHFRRFLAYSYRLGSPLDAARLGLTAERLDRTPRNAFPASVWAFRRAGVAPDNPPGRVQGPPRASGKPVV
jgi:hypothetical protein